MRQLNNVKLYSNSSKILWTLKSRSREQDRNSDTVDFLLAGAALEQIHVFALAHILRRPIIVYGIKFVKSFRGENIDLARFQGMSHVTVLNASIYFIFLIC